MASDPEVTGSLFSMKAFDAERDLPIVYSYNYNMSMVGFELTHNFDTKKYTKLADYLSELFHDTHFAREKLQTEMNDEGEDKTPERTRKLRYLTPNRPVNIKELLYHHVAGYVDRVHGDKSLIARITELWLFNLVPFSLIESRLLTPIKWQVAGTIFATHLAMQHGWAINLGGGFHQSSSNAGETFCIFSDILVTIKYIWRKHPLQKFMIIDVDAHQATGLERDLSQMKTKNRKNIFMLDIFNGSIQPPDEEADKGIDLRVELGRFVGDATYITKLKESLVTAFAQYKPTMIIYIAGQDVLRDDQLGLMNISDEALIQRDELVFSAATERHRCPIVMLLGGGYLTRGVKVQANSIRALFAKGLIWGGHRSGSRSLSRPRRQPEEVVGSSASNTAKEEPSSIKPKSVKKANTAVASSMSNTVKEEPSSNRPKSVKANTSEKTKSSKKSIKESPAKHVFRTLIQDKKLPGYGKGKNV